MLSGDWRRNPIGSSAKQEVWSPVQSRTFIPSRSGRAYIRNSANPCIGNPGSGFRVILPEAHAQRLDHWHVEISNGMSQKSRPHKLWLPAVAGVISIVHRVHFFLAVVIFLFIQ